MATDDLEEGQRDNRFDDFFSDPAVQQGLRELAQAEQVSRQPQGNSYFHEGKLREAIEEYRNDTELEITTCALASVVERAYCHMGDAYLFLGELEDAVVAYTRALETWQAYGYGEMPHASLAAAYLEQGRADDAIRVCEEHPAEAEDPCVKHVLAEARRLKAGGEPSPEPVLGCRRIELPFRVVGRPGD